MSLGTIVLLQSNDTFDQSFIFKSVITPNLCVAQLEKLPLLELSSVDPCT